jgi:hypothetical protein
MLVNNCTTHKTMYFCDHPMFIQVDVLSQSYNVLWEIEPHIDMYFVQTQQMHVEKSDTGFTSNLFTFKYLGGDPYYRPYPTVFNVSGIANSTATAVSLDVSRVPWIERYPITTRMEFRDAKKQVNYLVLIDVISSMQSARCVVLAKKDNDLNSTLLQNVTLPYDSSDFKKNTINFSSIGFDMESNIVRTVIYHKDYSPVTREYEVDHTYLFSINVASGQVKRIVIREVPPPKSTNAYLYNIKQFISYPEQDQAIVQLSTVYNFHYPVTIHIQLLDLSTGMLTPISQVKPTASDMTITSLASIYTPCQFKADNPSIPVWCTGVWRYYDNTRLDEQAALITFDPYTGKIDNNMPWFKGNVTTLFMAIGVIPEQ